MSAFKVLDKNGKEIKNQRFYIDQDGVVYYDLDRFGVQMSGKRTIARYQHPTILDFSFPDEEEDIADAQDYTP